MSIVGHFINDKVVDIHSRLQDIYNPATGGVIRQVAIAPKSITEASIAAAQAAFPEWRDTPPVKRARIMFRYKQLLEGHADEICCLIGQEHGKIMHDAAGELQRGIENVEYAYGET
ncbi:aldehyde dehydrogenase family protein [Xenorhabdus sp. PB62.4]|uniref:aldehyde dehydrogenase family protein n=1 Tax=Xenorhabdus sp. PB62.4 TaxID=1851573 RepID=UPI0016575DEB|nr:aldehyde dehydrogenase family protein [Xenorhabdus sp. PB62.4]MBC8953648.1 bifunctional proline dehydrogenase/pyrroline-5-carboxylate dehydrogenase [Xenorhabdus sp. PB62.4]